MLSRVAERVYWLARYLERAENTARLLNVYSNLLLDLPKGTHIGWHTLVQITGFEEAFSAANKSNDERSVIRFLLAEQNGVSILSILSMLRENARTTREIIPSEAFEQINNLYIYAKENVTHGIARGPRHKLFEEIIVNCQQLTGLLAGTMSLNNAYNFIQIGRYLERADMTTRIVDVGSSSLLPDLTKHSEARAPEERPFENILWMNVLRSLSAYQMYRQHVQDRVNGEDVVMFLLQDKAFPRALAHCLTQVSDCLTDLPHNKNALRQVAGALHRVGEAKIPELLSSGLLQFIDDLQVDIAAVHEEISHTWFLK